MYNKSVYDFEKNEIRGIDLNEIYLDNSATTKVSPIVAEYIKDVMLEHYGNPSSLYNKGLQSLQKLTEAKKQLADSLGCSHEQIYITSGGTEADNLAVFGAVSAKKRRGNKIVTTAFEHAAILTPFAQLEKQGFEATYVYPDTQGEITADAIADAIDEQTIFLSVMMVNNEVGTILPIGEIVKAARRKNKDILIHCDAVQAFGKLPISVKSLDVDLLSISGHKIHAPKGVGALYVKKGVRINPILFGGAQQNQLRPGTENLPLACGFGLAASLAKQVREENYTHMEQLNTYLKEQLNTIPEIVINSKENALPYIINLSAVGVRSEIMLHFLEAKGIYVSSGSACSKGEKSHVLRSMKLDDNRIDSALRISFSEEITKEHIDILIDSLKEGLQKIARSK